MPARAPTSPIFDDLRAVQRAHGYLPDAELRRNAEPIDLINQRLVLGNQVVFGSVNANPRHFKMGVKDFVTIQKKWPGALNRLLTNKIPWQDHKKWFTERGSGIKSTLEIQ